MKSILSSAVLILSLVISGMVLTTGCRKKKDTIAKIHVKDENNAPVAGCVVILKGVSTTNNSANVNLNERTETNAAGEAIFNFNEVYKLGMAGVAVLNIDAEKNGRSGSGIIKIEEETTNEETVFI